MISGWCRMQILEEICCIVILTFIRIESGKYGKNTHMLKGGVALGN